MGNEGGTIVGSSSQTPTIENFDALADQTARYASLFIGYLVSVWIGIFCFAALSLNFLNQ